MMLSHDLSQKCQVTPVQLDSKGKESVKGEQERAKGIRAPRTRRKLMDTREQGRRKIDEYLLKYIGWCLQSNDKYVRYGSIKNVNSSLF